MKKAKKVIALTLCAVMLVVGSVAGTMAYLTSTTATVTNTFTVGNVTITLDEADVNLYGEKVVVVDGKDVVATADNMNQVERVTSNDYKLIPGHNYVKDPTVHVGATSEDSWLIVKVTNPISGIEAGTTIANQMADKWTAIDEEKGIYAYNDVVSAGNDIVVFEEFTIAGTADVASHNGESITVQAYAIQEDGFDSAAAAWAAAPLQAWLN